MIKTNKQNFPLTVNQNISYNDVGIFWPHIFRSAGMVRWSCTRNGLLRPFLKTRHRISGLSDSTQAIGQAVGSISINGRYRHIPDSSRI